MLGDPRGILTRLAISLALVLLVSLLAPAGGAAESIPDVHFAVLRLDYLTFSIKGAYEFSAPFHKSLPPASFTEEGDVFWHYRAAGDFGYTEIRSRLTGEPLVLAETVWMGRGRFSFPPQELFDPTVDHGLEHPAPASIIFHSFFGADSASAEFAWETVRDTDVVHRLASHGEYEAFLFDHFYTVGLQDPSTAEWIVVVFTRPTAPIDAGLVDMIWPRTLIMTGVPVVPQIEVHNFSDERVEIDLRLAIESSDGVVFEAPAHLDPLAADETRVVDFDAITDLGLDSMALHFDILSPDGSTWADAFPDNDSWRQDLVVTSLPVFRRTTNVPLRGIPLDFDGDGDADILQRDVTLRFWQNDGFGHFTDISEGSDVPLPHHPRHALAGDFDGDLHLDLVIIYYRLPPQLLLGDGTGAFRDGTSAAGLSSVLGRWHAVSFDKEKDGDLDLIFQSHGQETVMENDGTGVFSDVTAVSGLVSPNQTEHIAVGDVNGDSFPDLALTTWSTGGDGEVFLNNGDGTFRQLTCQTWGVPLGRGALIFDYDNDSRMDILWLRDSARGPSLLYRNMGNLVFEEMSSQVGVLPSGFHVDAADITGGGYPALVFSTGHLRLLDGAAYVEASALLVDRAGDLGDVYFVDIDNDGDIDICGEKAVFLNQAVSGEVLQSPVTGPDLRLEQGFPNPFSPETATGTTMRYFLSERAHVTLRIYNVAGQRVRTLVDETQSPQIRGFTVPWDGRTGAGERAPAGVYFYLLQAGERRGTKKIVIVR
ncbi:MAG: VCBS repeat-containing protein [Candidatus Eisenbacteria sp.]|nr:VCBS repeat-containing protein [Candidatus Eisenbacteria bacterium]